MKTRIIALLMVMVVVVLSFASCFGKKNNDSTGGGTGDGGNTNSNYPWTTTTLKFQMTDNSNGTELPSSCRRYLAGDLSKLMNYESATTVDDYIKARNDAAEEATNVKINYEYSPDTAGFTWGENVDKIDAEVRSGSTTAPDMYSNFVYDMVAVSLKGSFANLYSSTMYEDGHELAGEDHNYFEFTKLRDKYVDTGKDYMYDYMRSLTLSKFKMYCLSSDYFTDMVRAFLVVPVNIQLLETLDTDDSTDYLKDRVETFDENLNVRTKYTIEDFYELVKSKEWTYETLAKFSEIITKNTGGEEDIDIHDRVGFVLGTTSGLPASGMLYTTSITIINREMSATKGDYTYQYPGTYQTSSGSFEMMSSEHKDYAANAAQIDELTQFCDNLSALMKANGVITLSTEEAATSGYGNKDLEAIRNRFSTGDILFGGVITLGSLEYEEYKDMNADGKRGYGIVPVPLYRSGSNDKYLTQIHNVGKIGAISYTTKNFSQCTAYLNYQSTHSYDILNEYYNYKLAYDVGTGVTGNVEMLQYIRENVRSAFDKAFEDAVAYFRQTNEPNAVDEKWHQMLMGAKFELDNMSTEYSSLAPKKALALYQLETALYPSLPD